MLFVPFGAALRLRASSLARTALAALLVSLAIESLQLVAVAGRVTSTDDVILNVLGAVFGSALAARWLRRESVSGG